MSAFAEQATAPSLREPGWHQIDAPAEPRTERDRRRLVFLHGVVEYLPPPGLNCPAR